MCTQNSVKFCPFDLQILSRNEVLTSIKGSNSVTYLRKIMFNNPNLDVVNMIVYTNLIKFCPFVLKILSGNKLLTSIKGHNSVSNLQKIMINNPNLDLVNQTVYTKFG